MFISLKPLKERDGLTTQRVINRLRMSLADIRGIRKSSFAEKRDHVGRGFGRACDEQSSRCLRIGEQRLLGFAQRAGEVDLVSIADPVAT